MARAAESAVHMATLRSASGRASQSPNRASARSLAVVRIIGTWGARDAIFRDAKQKQQVLWCPADAETLTLDHYIVPFKWHFVFYILLKKAIFQ
jgi:hypothetical protein